MEKTIVRATPTKEHHPALGRVFSIVYGDGTQDFVYEETFYHQIPNYTTSKSIFLHGKILKNDNAYFRFEL